jgi:hypothetical protein
MNQPLQSRRHLALFLDKLRITVNHSAFSFPSLAAFVEEDIVVSKNEEQYRSTNPSTPTIELVSFISAP